MRFSERENYHKISIYIILEKYFSLFFILPKGYLRFDKTTETLGLIQGISPISQLYYFSSLFKNIKNLNI